MHTLNNGKKENRFITKRKLCSPSIAASKNKIIITYNIESNQTLYIDLNLDIRNTR